MENPIKDKARHYLYRYIRLDKDEPFYIGIGSKSKDEEKYNYYNRAKAIKKKNIIWEKIVNKTDYMIEILLESDDYEFIKQKEKEFIKLYGRIDKGTGTLANMTDGGDGSLGIIVSEESRKKRQLVHKGRKYSEEEKRIATQKRMKTLKENGYIVTEDHKDKIGNSRGQLIVQFSMDGKIINTYPSLRVAAKNSGCSIPEISSSLHAKVACAGGGYVWLYEIKLKQGKTDRLFTIVDKYLQNEGIRRSHIELETKIKIIKDYNKLEGKFIKPKCRLIADLYSMKPGIIEYYIKRQDTFLNRWINYQIKKKEFVELLEQQKI